MNYLALRTAVFERRFPSNSPVADWLEAAYNDVWNSAEWTFKQVEDATFYTTANGLSSGVPAASPKMPAGFANPLEVLDDQGGEVIWLPRDEFKRRYAPNTASGVPEAYMLSNRQIILGPAPASAYAFQVSYKRRISTRKADNTVQSGFFVADDDIPMWDDHHYLLVLRAKLIGLRDRSDPTASDLEGEFGRLLTAMKDEYVVQAPPRARQLPAWR